MFVLKYQLTAKKVLELWMFDLYLGNMNTDHEGSNSWIREMFFRWTKSCLSVAVDGTSAAAISDISLYNLEWMKAWRLTSTHENSKSLLCLRQLSRICYISE